MSVRDWHPGKIGLVWLVAIVAGILGFFIGVAVAEGSGETGLGVLISLGSIVAGIGVPVAITWEWLSEREKKD